MFVQGGGCSGMEYGFTLDESKNEDDFEIPLVDSKTLLIDATSMQYLSGAVIDYKEELPDQIISIIDMPNLLLLALYLENNRPSKQKNSRN